MDTSTLNAGWNQEGVFEGFIDEVRVWNCARSRQEIVDAMNLEVASAPGLVGRWGMNEGAGPLVSDSSGNGLTGYLSNGSRAPGAPFDINAAPDTPVALAPQNGSTITEPTCELRAHVADADCNPLEVKFFGRKFREPPASPFRIVALPDTQYYSRSYPGTFITQTRWIVENRDALNIVYVAHEGDIVDSATSTGQWQNANTAISILDTLPDLPCGLCVGNHDENPNGDPDGTTAFNNVFPYARYQGRPWYGGHMGNTNDNHYILFSAGGMDFIAIHLKYNTSPPSSVLNWVGSLLQTHPNRRAIIVGHSILQPTAKPRFSNMGIVIYEAVKDGPNVFMTLSGHFGGEALRTDVAAGTIYSMVADYQWHDNGGDGWLRILEFVPGDNVINVKTYSPKLNKWKRDNNSQFSLPYDMGGVAFTELATTSVTACAADTSTTWSGLEPARIYEWYATASDGHATVTGPVQRFTTPAVQPDFDASGHVDSDDLSAFDACSLGPNLSPPSGCGLDPGPDGRSPADFDKDGDVDQDDFGVLQRCNSGPDRSPQWNCAD